MLGVALIAGLIWYYRKRPEKEVVIEAAKPGIPAHTLAVSKLKGLREKKLWQRGEVKQYYIELSDILREYIEKRYMIKTHEKTTDEIFAGLKYIDIAKENKNILRQILTLSDLVKFAKEKPLPVENEECMDNAVIFVLETQGAVPAESAEGGKTHV